MKAIVGMLQGVICGLFLAIVVISFTQILGAGATFLGFTVWTFCYYTLCLGVCIALLILSKPARKHWRFMMYFFVAVFMVLGIGLLSFMEVSSGKDQMAQMQADFLAISMFGAKAVMYIAPGALTAFYGFVAFEGVTNATAHKPTITTSEVRGNRC